MALAKVYRSDITSLCVIYRDRDAAFINHGTEINFDAIGACVHTYVIAITAEKKYAGGISLNL